MNNNIQIAKTVIEEILRRLNIVKSSNYYKYNLNISGNVYDEILITDSEEELMKFLKIDTDALLKTKDVEELFNVMQSCPFLVKSFLRISDVNRVSNESIKSDMRAFLTICFKRGRFGEDMFVNNPLIYIKAIDHHFNTKIYKLIKEKAAMKLRYRLLSHKLNMNDIARISNINPDKVGSLIVLRNKFEDMITKEFKESPYPFIQYLEVMYTGEVQRDFREFIKSNVV